MRVIGSKTRANVTGGVLGVLLIVGAGPAAAAAIELPAVDCTADAQGMMTMSDGMKMPVAQMPGCSAAKAASSTTAATAAPTAKPTSGATAKPKATATPAAAAASTAKPKAVHAGTGGQASEQSAGLPVAPVGLLVVGVGVAALAGRRIVRGRG